MLVALGLFLLTRILTLTAFPIFNDEAIYLQYSQKIQSDWEKNKFISMNGEFTDWKPPLQYWMAAPFIDWGNDPLVAGRLVAFLVAIEAVRWSRFAGTLTRSRSRKRPDCSSHRARLE